MLVAKVNNLPTYPLRKWVVASINGLDRSLWFYGSFDEDDRDRALEAAKEIEGIVLENV